TVREKDYSQLHRSSDTPTSSGHNIPSAITSPDHQQGHDLPPGLPVQESRVLTCQRLPASELARRPTR
ncbi:MAG TPA: hypothetical protein VF788_18195, partial [Pseudonocardiaceae bacterium]